MSAMPKETQGKEKQSANYIRLFLLFSCRLDVSDAVPCSSNHEGRQVLNETFPMNVDQLFTLLFTNSKFFLDFHASRRTSDLTQTPWVHADTTGKRTRTVTLTVAIQQPIGPKSAQVTETQVGYCTHYCLKRHNITNTIAIVCRWFVSLS